MIPRKCDHYSIYVVVVVQVLVALLSEVKRCQKSKVLEIKSYGHSGKTERIHSIRYKLGPQTFLGNPGGGAGVFLVAVDLFTRCRGSPWLSLRVNANTNQERRMTKNIQIWLVAFAVVLLYFYGLDHFIMSAQGLPLNMDLTPSQ